jgi:poly(3-hydroxybutyrate) depolymerase
MMTFVRTALSILCIAGLNMGCGSSSYGASGGASSAAGTSAAGTSAAGTLNSTAGGSAGGGSGAATAGSSGSAGTATTFGNGGSAGAVSNPGQAGSAQAGSSGAGTPDAGPPSARQKAVPLGGASSAPNGYYEYLPPGYDGSSATPLLVFWHGVGEDGNGGSELSRLLSHGPPELISKDVWDNRRPFIVLSPQFSAVSSGITPGASCPSSAVIDAFFTWAIGHYTVDRKRVYLTGLSCGAIGSWEYLAQLKGSVVAAAVLLSGNPGDPTQAGSVWQRTGCALGDVAIWSLHGDQDDVVPYAPDHDTLTNLLACPAPPRRAATFTDVVGGGHGIWDPVYDLSGGSGDIYTWLLSNGKP